ncbi:MAG: hypothetical protein AAEA78_00600 [Methylophilaceae bacterium]
MKKLLLLLLLFLIPNLGFTFDKDVYSFKQYDLNGNLTLNGDIVFSYKEKNNKIIENIETNLVGELISYSFSMTRERTYGFDLWDIKMAGHTAGFTIFSKNINLNGINVGYNASNIVTSLDRSHPYFKDLSWFYYTEVTKEEKIKIGASEIAAILIETSGRRETGPGHGHCMFGQTGVIKVYSWYSKENHFLLKQIFEKRHCTPEEHRLLTKEILIIKNYSEYNNSSSG